MFIRDFFNPGEGARKYQTFFNRLFRHFGGNFLLVLVIDFSQFGIWVILPQSFGS